MLQKDHTEAWARVAETIFATAPDIERRGPPLVGNGIASLTALGSFTTGLCMLAARLNAAGVLDDSESFAVMGTAMREARRVNPGAEYLHTPGRWTDGVRLDFALRQARVPASARRRVRGTSINSTT